MKKIKSILIIVLIIILSIIMMKYFAGKRAIPKKTKVREHKIFVHVKGVKYETINTKIEATGRLSSLHRINITTEVQGRILSGNVPLKKGASFKKGDILFKIYDKEANLNHKARVSRFLNSVAMLLPDIKIDFPSSFDNWENFFRNINLDRDLPEIPRIRNLKEKVFLSSRNILGEYFQIKSEEIRLKKYTVKAPFKGSIVNVNFQVQSIANPGAVIAVVNRTDELELEVPIGIKYSKWIKKGDTVKISLPENEKYTDGKISRISEVIDPATQSLLVYIHLKNSNTIPLYSGLYLKAYFSNISFENSMKIPRNAVFNEDHIFIVENNRLQKRKIEIKMVDKDIIIFTGLEKGKLIVVESLINAKENSLVQIIR